MVIAGIEQVKRRRTFGCVRGMEGGVAVLNRVIGGIIERVTFGQSLEGGEGVSWADFWGKSHSGGGNSQCKSPEAAPCLRVQGGEEQARTE